MFFVAGTDCRHLAKFSNFIVILIIKLNLLASPPAVIQRKCCYAPSVFNAAWNDLQAHFYTIFCHSDAVTIRKKCICCKVFINLVFICKFFVVVTDALRYACVLYLKGDHVVSDIWHTYDL